MEKIWHALALDCYFTNSGLGMNYTKGFCIIPYYYRKLSIRAPRSFFGKGLIRVGEFHESLWTWLLLHPLRFFYDRDYCLAV